MKPSRLRRLGVAGFFFLGGIAAMIAAEGGLSLTLGQTNILQIPTLPTEAAELQSVGVGQPEVVLVGLALPRGFDPSRPTPVLFTSVTGDPYQSNIKEMEVYRERAVARGWVLLTGQPHPWPDRPQDTLTGRRVAADAAFRTLAELFPDSETWPTAFAGFSGGAKLAQILSGYFISRDRRVVGALMSGCNENNIVVVIDHYNPDRKKLKNMGYFLSSGRLDQVSSPEQMKDVRRTLRRRGAKNVRLETFDGPHANYLPHIDEALIWFEELVPAAQDG